MHIVHILTRLLRAGSEENTIATSIGQMQDGAHITFLYGPDSNPDRVRQLLPDADFIEIPDLVREISLRRDLRAYRQLIAVLRDLKPDVVHTHQSKAGITGRLAAKRANVPLIIHGVHILPFLGETFVKNRVYLALEKITARATDGFIYVSQGMMDANVAGNIGNGLPHEIVPSGFDLDKFRNATPPGDAAALIGPDQPVIIAMLAAFEPRKNHLALLDVVANLIAQGANIRVLFAGEGETEARVRAKIDALGLQDHVRMLGYRTDPERIISLADICVLCSVKEGLPRSVLQYVAGGKALVMFNIFGIDALITDGVNGRIVDELNWDAFGRELSALIENEDQRKALSDGARNTNLSDWDWRKMGKRTTAFYKRAELAKSAEQEPATT